MLIAFILLTLMFQQDADAFFKAAMEMITGKTGWFLILVSNLFILAAFYFAFSRFGQIRIGGVDAKPEFSTLAWFAMLLSAGMGIGLMFWSVAEPVAYFTDWWGTPLNVEARTPEALSAAMGATMFHWGLHPWSIYAVTALALAFFAFNKGLPLTIRSTFYPLLGESTWKAPGDLIDIVAVSPIGALVLHWLALPIAFCYYAFASPSRTLLRKWRQRRGEAARATS